MKKSKIEKLLKAEANDMPDPLNKIKTAAIAENLLPEKQADGVCGRGNAAVKIKSNKKILSLAAAGVAIATAIALTLTFTSGGGNSLNNGIIDGGNKPVLPTSPSITHVNLSTEKSYGMGAVSTVKLLANGLPAASVKALAAATVAAKEENVKTQIDKFNQYFSALDSFFDSDIVSTQTLANTDADYPYDVKMVIAGKDFAGNAVSYTMYYTEKELGATYSLSPYSSVGDHDEHESDDNGGVKAKYTLTGVMLVNGVDYLLEGERSEESESDETETKLKIKAYANVNDKTSYVQMEQKSEIESGEKQTKYVYSIYSKNNLTEQTAVDFESETKNGKVETEYKIEFRNGAGKGKYAVKRESVGDGAKIRVKYDVDGQNGEFYIMETTLNGVKQYEYKFSDGSNKSFPKHDEHSNDKHKFDL